MQIAVDGRPGFGAFRLLVAELGEERHALALRVHRLGVLEGHVQECAHLGRQRSIVARCDRRAGMGQGACVPGERFR